MLRVLIGSNYPVNSTKFRVSASQQLQKSMRSGKLDRDGSNYILNPNFVEETAKPNKSTHTAGVFTSTQASQAPNPIVEASLQLMTLEANDHRSLSINLALESNCRTSPTMKVSLWMMMTLCSVTRLATRLLHQIKACRGHRGHRSIPYI